jgi:hypothetical protein
VAGTVGSVGKTKQTQKKLITTDQLFGVKARLIAHLIRFLSLHLNL